MTSRRGAGTGGSGDQLRVAHLVADAAGEVALRHFCARQPRSWSKGDGSVVTDADLATETRIRTALHRLAPGVEVQGEEFAGSGQGDRWIVDPIDGTENFSRGNPIWGTLVARMSDGEVTEAVVSAPALGRRWWASREAGSFTDDGRQLRVSDARPVADASLCYGGVHEYAQADLDRLMPLLRSCRTAWGWGNFWGHMHVAEGAVDGALSNGTSVWDIAAPSLIVSEAGGMWSDFAGSRRLDQGNFISASPWLSARLLAVTGFLLAGGETA
jgi:histidinol-phosphatase